MSPAEIQNLLRAQPFVPFRIVTPVRTYEVRHPDLVLVGLATVTIGVLDVNNPTLYSLTHIVSIRHIIHLEPEGQPVPSGGSVAITRRCDR